MKKNLKICGNTNYEDVEKMYNLGINVFGFIVNFPKSPRSNSFSEFNNLSKKIKKNLENVFLVSVLINPSLDVIEKLDLKNIDAIQLHGSESYTEIRKIRDKTQKNIEIWKVFTIETVTDKTKLEIQIEKMASDIDLFLFDVKKTADYELPKHVFYETTFIDKMLEKSLKIGIAGGINPENINNFSKYFNKVLIDISSGVEKEAGKKDMKKVKEIIKNYL